jgi:hypothetical protein
LLSFWFESGLVRKEGFRDGEWKCLYVTYSEL